MTMITPILLMVVISSFSGDNGDKSPFSNDGCDAVLSFSDEQFSVSSAVVKRILWKPGNEKEKGVLIATGSTK